MGIAAGALQALYDDAAAALQAAVAPGRRRLMAPRGLGVGEVDRPLADAARETPGRPFVAAREAVRPRRTGRRARRRSAARAPARSAVQCVAPHELRCRGRGPGRDRGGQAGRMAEHLGITRSSVSRRLDAALGARSTRPVKPSPPCWNSRTAPRHRFRRSPPGPPPRVPPPPPAGTGGPRDGRPEEGTNASSARAGRGDGA
ncbi:transcriptional regulator [Kocuria rhizophila]|nr:transcriptional regulator [Kocuria rhizophila]